MGVKATNNSVRIIEDFEEQIEEMFQCKDLVELENKYGNQKELIDAYNRSKITAPDITRLTQAFISDWEGTMQRQSRNCVEIQNGKPFFHAFYYRAAGYDLMIRGFNRGNFREYIYQNVHFVSMVQDDEKPQIIYTILKHLAAGASIACFIAFLKAELIKPSVSQIEDEGKFPFKKNDSNKPTVASYALLHVFWSKYDNTKAITDTNKLKWSNQYGISPNTLKMNFGKYFERSDRKPFSNDRRSSIPFLENFKIALGLIETLCPQAFKEAEKEFKVLEELHNPKCC